MKQIATYFSIILIIVLLSGCDNDKDFSNSDRYSKNQNYHKDKNTTTDINSTTSYKIKKSGQTKSFVDGDDAYYEKGEAPRYTRASDIVTDELTGAMWQDDNRLQDGENIYRDFYKSTEYCNTLSFGGYEDWRVPNIEELSYIVDYGRVENAISPVFENIDIWGGPYWSSTSSKTEDANAWDISLNDGVVWDLSSKESEYVTMCIRGVDVSDANFKNSKLEWQDDKNSSMMEWSDAVEYCEDLTLDAKADWRLPNINELKTIVGVSTFKFLQQKPYWSSSSYEDEWSKGEAWFIDFYNGWIEHKSKVKTDYDKESFVRCVRGENNQ